MQQLTNISKTDAPKVFGHLYIAIFSNGTVKAGMSGKNPNDRVTSHANAGKAFGISMDTSFCVPVYTDDTRARERLMHQEISALATLTTGREWFKFDNATVAVNFASAYLCMVERMSFAERPSAEEISLREKASQKRFEGLFPAIFPLHTKAFTLPEPATEPELAALASVMDGYSLSVNATIASNIVSLEEQISDRRNGEASNTPILSDAINEYFVEFNKRFQVTGVLLADEEETCLNEIIKNEHPFNKEICIKIIQAAALYPAFFYEAMGFKVAA